MSKDRPGWFKKLDPRANSHRNLLPTAARANSHRNLLPTAATSPPDTPICSQSAIVMLNFTLRSFLQRSPLRAFIITKMAPQVASRWCSRPQLVPSGAILAPTLRNLGPCGRDFERSEAHHIRPRKGPSDKIASGAFQTWSRSRFSIQFLTDFH